MTLYFRRVVYLKKVELHVGFASEYVKLILLEDHSTPDDSFSDDAEDSDDSSLPEKEHSSEPMGQTGEETNALDMFRTSHFMDLTAHEQVTVFHIVMDHIGKDLSTLLEPSAEEAEVPSAADIMEKVGSLLFL